MLNTKKQLVAHAAARASSGQTAPTASVAHGEASGQADAEQPISSESSSPRRDVLTSVASPSVPSAPAVNSDLHRGHSQGAAVKQFL